MSRREELVMSVVMTDRTFSKQSIRGSDCWVGKCLYCNTKLVVELDGSSAATLEHVMPRSNGGTDDIANLALACFSCNSEKGRRQDTKKKIDPVRIQRYLDVRRSRWRDSP